LIRSALTIAPIELRLACSAMGPNFACRSAAMAPIAPSVGTCVFAPVTGDEDGPGLSLGPGLPLGLTLGLGLGVGLGLGLGLGLTAVDGVGDAATDAPGEAEDAAALGEAEGEGATDEAGVDVGTGVRVGWTSRRSSLAIGRGSMSPH